MTFDICPALPLITQAWGCTDYSGEWTDWSCGNPGHRHTGIDLGTTAGGTQNCNQPVYATRAGVIVAMNDPYLYLGPYAACLQIPLSKDQSIFLEYGHLNLRVADIGADIKAGQLIGFTGSQGSSSACHLHVEARLDGPYQANNGQDIDPAPFLNFEEEAMVLPLSMERAFIRLVFLAGLGREPTDGELDGYAGRLLSDGTNLNEILAEIADSGEGTGNRALIERAKALASTGLVPHTHPLAGSAPALGQ